MTDPTDHNHNAPEATTMLDNDYTQTRTADRDDRPPLTRRLGVGLAMVIIGSFGFGVWACGTVAGHEHEATYNRAVARAVEVSSFTHSTSRLRDDLKNACKGGVAWTCPVEGVGIITGDPGNLAVSVDSADNDNDRIAAGILDHAPAGFDRVTVYGPQGQTLATAGQEAN